MDDRQPLTPDQREPHGPSPEEPVAEGNPEDRIRAALGLARGPLPRVASRWLRQYHDYLAAHLSFPFEARRAGETGRGDPRAGLVTVVALLDPEKTTGQEADGLICAAQSESRLVEIPLVDVEVEPGHGNQQLLDDYWYWFWNWRFDPAI